MSAARNVTYRIPKAAVICLTGWHGYTEYPVQVVGETPKRYRIRATQVTPLAGSTRWLVAGQTALVPKYAVRFVERGPKEVVKLRSVSVAHPAITHCDNCGCDWLDNGLNPIGCPYCKQSEYEHSTTTQEGE